jgi:hypothetical protein
MAFFVPFRVVKHRSKCAKLKHCKYPLSHSHPTIRNVHATRLRAGFGSLVGVRNASRKSNCCGQDRLLGATRQPDESIKC